MNGREEKNLGGVCKAAPKFCPSLLVNTKTSGVSISISSWVGREESVREAPGKKSRIRETKHLLTDADCSTDPTILWTKNTQKPKCGFHLVL